MIGKTLALGKPLRADRRRSKRPEADFSGKVARMQRWVRKWVQELNGITPWVLPHGACLSRIITACCRRGPDAASDERNLRMILSHADQLH
ncbi:hypothetical protein EC919_101191 [Pseudomonas graminis]|nr:hypothetical protein EC919_101191 [Pseudomonas graminis]